MELREALISASVQDFKVDVDTRDIMTMNGDYRKMVTGRRVSLSIQLNPRNNEELDWLVKSLQENGNRISLIPDGSPIIHPSQLAKKATAPHAIKTADKPQTPDSAW